MLQAKRLYLNVPFFLVRAAFYFAIWNALAYVLNRWSREQDEGGPRPVGSERKFRQLSAPGLMAYGLTITFASVDWVMSLDPHWFSTIYGVLFMGGQALAALAFAIVALAVTSRTSRFPRSSNRLTSTTSASCSSPSSCCGPTSAFRSS